MYWSRDLNRVVSTTVGSILEGVDQLNKYMETVAKGRLVRWSDSGREELCIDTATGLRGIVID